MAVGQKWVPKIEPWEMEPRTKFAAPWWFNFDPHTDVELLALLDSKPSISAPSISVPSSLEANRRTPEELLLYRRTWSLGTAQDNPSSDGIWKHGPNLTFFLSCCGFPFGHKM